jgi:hypothetical protein
MGIEHHNEHHVVHAVTHMYKHTELFGDGPKAKELTDIIKQHALSCK